MTIRSGTATVPRQLSANGNGSAPAATAELQVGLAPVLEVESPLYESCHYVLATPGKRFRGSVLEAAAGYGPAADAAAVGRAAAAIELFHAATLAHDDVVDDGRLRRGKATIGAHAGNIAASLAGGWLFARTIELLAAAGDEAVTHFAAAASVVCEGEMLETRDLYDVTRSRDRYLETIEAKTASLIALAGWLGAHLGGAGAGQAARLEHYGMAVGMAFQIADDILDLVADEARTGKVPGTDLRQGVYTLPTIYALEADAGLREGLLAGAEEEDLPELVERIRASGAIETALAECEAWIEEAIAVLPDAPAAAAHEERLVSLAHGIRKRLVETAAP